jgi:hypothetical protein
MSDALPVTHTTVPSSILTRCIPVITAFIAYNWHPRLQTPLAVPCCSHVIIGSDKIKN